jgi:hypothetical protein
MKLALVVHAPCAERSFFVADGRAYAFEDGEPYSAPGSIENRIFRNIWNIPFLSDGWFFNYQQGLPRRADVDLVLAVYEVQAEGAVKNAINVWRKSPARFLAQLRHAFPNAAVVGYVKEMHPQHVTFGVLTRKWFGMCDAVALPYAEATRRYFSGLIDRPVYFLPFPYRIEEIRAAVPAVPRQKILMHATRIHRARPAARDLAERLARKHGLDFVDGIGLDWPQWLELIRRSAVCLNLDPLPKLGQVPIECAILGTAHIGGLADAAVALFPDAATNDPNLLDVMLSELARTPYDPRPAAERVEVRHGFAPTRAALEAILRGPDRAALGHAGENG